MTSPDPLAPLPPRLDALVPPEMARKAEEVGVGKVEADTLRTLLLAVLAGAFIALGANLSTIAMTDSAAMPWGWARLVGGLAFSLGLGLVVVGGAELFTGNTLVVMAWASGRVRLLAVLRHWGLVYLGNAVGAVATAGLVFASGQYRMAGGRVGRTVLDAAAAKVALVPQEAFALGVLCNVLVCLAVWMSMSARSTVDRLAVVALPVAAFVAGGFEHSIANLYVIPLAMAVRAFAPAAYWAPGGPEPARYDAVALDGLLANLVPVTLGNLVGGAVLVGLVYWVVYLRRPAP